MVSIVCAYGLIILFSASGNNFYPYVSKQLSAFLIFMPLAVFIALIDIRIILEISYPLYLISLVALIIVEFFGKSAMGATRWLDLGFISIQPSEIIKISLILMLARYFHLLKGNITLMSLLPPLVASLLPIFLIIKQPDLGTAIITLIIVSGIFFAAGVKIIYFIIIGIVTIISMPIIFSLLHEYQKNRILTFLDPERDPLGAGYNIIQSKIAIGSGGFWGKGLSNGTQSHLKFLPEYQTDFIFSFLMEELGFIGGIILLTLYSIILLNFIYIAVNSKSIFASLVSLGIAIFFLSHIFINIAMVMGLVPVVGVPLPFISYGRTMLCSMLIGLGLVMNSYINQHKKL
ncbi:MAG: rod shape-determining protein RodA [Rickettsiaceae bacterium]|nr:rod shape-determining protein RodA [Rickettsiaceae bacterium]